MDLKPQQKLGQYTIVRKLAEGGMAEIYLATRVGPSGFGKKCVLKRVKDKHKSDARFRALFEHEAKLAVSLDHENIVEIHDFQAAEDDELYLTMQYIDGCSLEQLRRGMPTGVIPPFLTAKVGRDIASALSYAYNVPGPDGKPLSLIHRDISPHNILISRKGAVKLTDFGIAKPVSKDTTGGFKGKLAYMSPEQAQGKKADHRTDIFALAVVLFELCTGSRPFDAENDVLFIHQLQIASEPAPRATSLNPAVPEALADVLEKALRRNPANRYQTAKEFEEALEAILKLAPSDVDKDLGRFVIERLGPERPELVLVPQLPSGAFDETQLVAPNGTAEMVSSGSQDETLLPPTGTPLHLPALEPELAARQSRVTPSPKLDQPQPIEPFSSSNPTSQELPALPKSPAVEGGTPRPLLTPAMKLALGILVPFMLVGGAVVAFEISKSQTAPTVIPVPQPPPVAAPVIVAQPLPVPVTPPPALNPEVHAEVAAAPPPAAVQTEVHSEAPKSAPKSHPPKPVVRGKGTLVLQSNPYSEVYEGKKRVSDDGIGNFEVGSGRHVLIFKYLQQRLTYVVQIPENQSVCLRASFAPGAPSSVGPCPNP